MNKPLLLLTAVLCFGGRRVRQLDLVVHLDNSTPGSNPCATKNLKTRTAGTLTIGTDIRTHRTERRHAGKAVLLSSRPASPISTSASPGALITPSIMQLGEHVHARRTARPRAPCRRWPFLDQLPDRVGAPVKHAPMTRISSSDGRKCCLSRPALPGSTARIIPASDDRQIPEDPEVDCDRRR